MKTRFFILFFAFFLALPPAWAAEKSTDKPQFHPPQTAAEKALDHILMLDKTDRDLPYFIFKLPERTKNWDKDYSRFFTQGLQDAWEKEYLSIPEEDGVRYVGESFLTCGNGDKPDSLLYYTSKGNAHEAYIDIVWPEYIENSKLRHPPPYKMIKEDGLWKLDSVICGEELKFNAK